MYTDLITLRKKQNKTGKYMSELLNISKATYSKKENRLIKFSLEEAKIISGDINMTIEAIFFNNQFQ